jgi:tetratricopeptide (TPR) repeat protein
MQGLGDIALQLSNYDSAKACYDEALPLYRQVGDVPGEADCYQRLGDVAAARSDDVAAGAWYDQALQLYQRVDGPSTIGSVHRRLTRIASREHLCQLHINVTRDVLVGTERDGRSHPSG